MRVLEFNLQQAGFETRAVGRASEAMKAAHALAPDVVLLDLMLPDGPGTEVCRALKSDPQTRNVPVIMTTAKGEEIDRVVGFEARRRRLRRQALQRARARPPRAGDPARRTEGESARRRGRALRR
ncbi:MAG: response regulator [Polyangiales bacterium]